MRKVFILTVLAGTAFGGAAHADQAGWCAAYARDFADSRTTDKVLWQHKYDIAQKSCLDNEVTAAPVAEVTKKVEAPVADVAKKVEVPPIKVAAIPAANPVAKPPAKPAAPAPVVPEKTKVASGPPEIGSAEWNAYCAKKYSSFDAKTGTYQSLTGVQRKCLYTG